MKEKVQHRKISNMDKVKVFENKNYSTNSLNDAVGISICIHGIICHHTLKILASLGYKHIPSK